MIATNIWFWVGFIAFVLAMLALDLGVFHRTPHVVSPKEASDLDRRLGRRSRCCSPAGSLFFDGHSAALTFLTGYVIEESLSIDNIFVIVLIFEYFRVPEQYQHRVLFCGILGALVMRGLFIGLGAALLARFHWIIYIFGALLVVTGVRMAVKQDEEFDGEQNPVVKAGAARRCRSPTTTAASTSSSSRTGGATRRRCCSCCMLVEVTDLIFAIDSIPAIFGVTRDPFIVFTSNIFAVLGCARSISCWRRSSTKFYLLKYGLAVILTFVGVKMLGETWIHIRSCCRWA